MTREELIDHLQHLEQYTHYSEDAPALREAIKMLTETHGNTRETHACDCISRRKAFEYFVTLWECIGTIMDRDEWEDICMTTANEIPSAQPEIEERKEESAQNVPKEDLISRKAAIDAVNGVIADYIPTLYGRYEALPLEMAKAIKRLPTAEPTLYGYNIKHLAFVATVMEKEGVTAEYAARTFGDMSRASRMLIEELQEKVEKSLSAMQLPSAQPEIIRCKECLMHGVCRFEQGLGLDGYCSQAERRTDENNNE